MGRGVEDRRRAGTDRDPRPVGAVAQLVEADDRVDDAACVARQGDRRRRRAPRPRVDEAQRAVVLHVGQRPAVRAEVEVDERVAVAAHHADRRRALQQRGEQVAARLQRVVERDALAGEQQRAVQIVLGQRLRAEPLRVRGHGLAARVAALVQRDRARDHRHDEERGDARQDHPQAAVGALARGRALVEEGPLAGGQLGIVVGRPVAGCRQARAAIELAAVAAAGVPFARGGTKVAVQPPAFRVVLQPAAQARPLAQQGLVRDLDLALGDREQAAVGELVEDGAGVVAELLEGHAGADDGLALSLPGEPQQDAARHPLAVAVQSPVRALGQAGHRRVHAARLLIGGEPQEPSVASLPQLEQAGGEQRQGPRLTLDVVDQRVRQVGLDLQAGVTSRQLDRAAQLVAAHRPDGRLVGAEQPPQLRIGGAAAVEVRADGHEHDRSPARVARRSHQRVHERRTLALVAAGHEGLLELVDGEHQPPFGGRRGGRVVQRPQRMLARAQQRDRPGLAAGQDALAQGREQAGAQHRRLAAARRTDETQHRRARQAGHHLRHEPLAPEEERGVLGLERGEALEGADDDVLRDLRVARARPPARRRRRPRARPRPRAARRGATPCARRHRPGGGRARPAPTRSRPGGPGAARRRCPAPGRRSAPPRPRAGPRRGARRRPRRRGRAVRA